MCNFEIPPPSLCTDVVTPDGGGDGTTYTQNETLSLVGSSTSAIFFDAPVAPSIVGFFGANGTVAYEIVLGGRDRSATGKTAKTAAPQGNADFHVLKQCFSSPKHRDLRHEHQDTQR